MKPKVTIFTDGGASPNPGPGGYGILILYGSHEQELNGGEKDTTNNRMELTAACVALETLTEPHEVILYTDSEYLKKGITEWLPGWVRKAWKDVKNPDLWQRLYKATQRHDITWKWVKGHAGNQYNERVDQLATHGRLRVLGKTPALETASSEPSSAAKFNYSVYTATDFDSKAKRGAWAAVIERDGNSIELSGTKSGTTEYELSLTAALKALEALQSPGSAQFYVDNEVVQKGAANWVKGWRKNGWLTAQGKPVVHQELWQKLDALIQSRTIKWQWSRGASLRADALASEARKAME
jgi:ribonuclease HI